MSSEQQDHQNTAPVKTVNRCAITSEGITIAGYQLSWILIILIVVVIFFIWKRDTLSGMFNDKPTVMAAPAGISATVNPNGISTFRTNPGGPVGDIGRMFGHSTW
jgi:hypothetical protein